MKHVVFCARAERSKLGRAAAVNFLLNMALGWLIPFLGNLFSGLIGGWVARKEMLKVGLICLANGMLSALVFSWLVTIYGSGDWYDMVFGLPGAWTLFAFYIIVGGFGSALGGVTSVAIRSGKGPKMFDER